MTLIDMDGPRMHFASKMDASDSVATLTIKNLPDVLYARLKARGA